MPYRQWDQNLHSFFWRFPCACRVLKGAGSQSVERCVSTYSGGLALARHFIGALAKLLRPVFTLGVSYISLPVLWVRAWVRVCGFRARTRHLSGDSIVSSGVSGSATQNQRQSLGVRILFLLWILFFKKTSIARTTEKKILHHQAFLTRRHPDHRGWVMFLRQ